jgi:WD40 repeat protein
MRALTGHTKVVSSLALSFDSSSLLSASADGTNILFDFFFFFFFVHTT